MRVHGSSTQWRDVISGSLSNSNSTSFNQPALKAETKLDKSQILYFGTGCSVLWTVCAHIADCFLCIPPGLLPLNMSLSHLKTGHFLLFVSSLLFHSCPRHSKGLENKSFSALDLSTFMFLPFTMLCICSVVNINPFSQPHHPEGNRHTVDQSHWESHGATKICHKTKVDY